MTSEEVEFDRLAEPVARASAPGAGDISANRHAWPMIWALMVVLSLNIIDRQMIGLLGDPISKELGLSDSQLGLLGGLGFAAVHAVASFPWGWIADRPRISRMWVISAALAIWSAATALSGAAQNFAQILLARVGVAAGEAGCMPPAQALIAEAVPRAKLSRALAIFGLGIPIGAFIGKAGGGLLNDLFGWRSAFLLVGAPGVLFAVALVIAFRKLPRPPARPAGTPVFRRALGQILRSRAIVFNALGNIFTGALSAGMGFWGMVHFQRNLGLSPGEAGMWLGLQTGVTGVIGVLIGGWVSDKLAGQKPSHYMTSGIVGQLIAPVMLVFAWWTDQWWLALLLTFFPTMCDNLAYAGSAAATQRLLTSDVRASATSLIAMVVTLAGPGLGITLIGVVSDVVQGYLPASAPPSESVRYVLMGSAVLFVLPAYFFWLAGRNMEREITRLEAEGS